MLVRKVVLNTTLMMIITVIIIAFLVITSLVVASTEAEVSRKSEAAQDFQVNIRTMASLMSDMETGLRGYVLTGQSDFLGPYHSAQNDLPAVWTDLARRAQEVDAASTETETLISLLIETKNRADVWTGEYAAPTLKVRTAGDITGTTSTASLDRGKALFDSFRTATNSTEQHIKQHVAAYRSDVERISNARVALLLVLSMLALGNAVFSLRLIGRDRRLQQAAIARSEAERELLETLIENMPVAVRLVSAPKGDIVIQNRLSEQLTPAAVWNDLPVDERARHFGITLPDGSPLTAEQYPTIQSLRTGATVTNFEVVQQAPRSAPRTLLLNSAPLREASGRVTGAVVVIQDVTQAKALDQRKDEFIATAAHELRNPLTALSGHYQLLMKLMGENEARPPVKRHLDGIGKQIKRVNALIERVLDASRIELGRLVLTVTSFDMVKLAQSALVDAEVADNAAHVMRLVAPGEPVIGLWDETRISQAMTNLLGNAARYSPDGTEIVLSVAATPDEVRIEVRDRGPGVAEDVRPSLFDRYYQAERPAGVQIRPAHELPRPSTRGLGLGLYITLEIVRAHGGDIGIEPNPGGGSIFWFTLPRRQAPGALRAS